MKLKKTASGKLVLCLSKKEHKSLLIKLGNGKLTCGECGREVSGDAGNDWESFHGSDVLCRECFDKQYDLCSDCGKKTDNSDLDQDGHCQRCAEAWSK